MEHPVGLLDNDYVKLQLHSFVVSQQVRLFNIDLNFRAKTLFVFKKVLVFSKTY